VAFDALARQFAQDLERCGAIVISEHGDQKPARLRVTYGDRVTDCLLFLWNITPGGGKSDSRPKSERRIQVTAATKFPLEVGKRTIIGGWCDETGSWGFWDVLRHTRFSLNSPSFQVRVQTLECGFHDGVATQSRKTDPPEIVVSVSPAFLLWYVQDGAVLHNSGQDALEVQSLLKATPEEEREFLDNSTDEAQVIRRYRLTEMMRAVRDAKFRPAVLQAYSNRCALCPISLNLVDAAHIVPVKRPHSTDEVTNGLALCRLHHAAYDASLVGVKSDYTILINPAAVDRLKELKFLHGLDEFKALLRPKIYHPSELEVRPRADYLRLGMIERHWPQELVG
jgi:putative restriction endonuclease